MPPGADLPLSLPVWEREGLDVQICRPGNPVAAEGIAAPAAIASLARE
jgi:hypothetical protein